MDKIAYFDNAATTFPKPEIVYKFMDEFYRSCGVNVGRGQYKLASKAHFLTEETRSLLLELFHCENKKVIFSGSATESINLVLQGLITEKIKNVYITSFEHNSITRTLHYLKNKYNFNIYELEINKETLEYKFEEIDKQFEKNIPDILVMSHGSNVCGLISPLEKIFLESKKYNCINIADICQTAGLIDIDLSSDIYDVAVFAGHKTLYGPFGVSGMIFKDSLNIKPLLYGGTGIDSANQGLPKDIPSRYEVGSHNIMGISGLNASLKWIKEIGINNISLKEKNNFIRLFKLLKEYSNIRIIGFKDFDSHVGVISCEFDNYTSDEIGKVLDKFNVGVRTGLHCSPLAHKFLGTFPSGTVRFSVSYFTSDEDFKQLREALSYIQDNS
ncbi:aminotransferase class V-fold PLP-dependent enzyme [Fusobacterium sp. MFO224]|uniref:aminotransferase class V-fold PLP-dependent enzyme n=1 Tax=Fusobacterium sp. MFO224 TaxID=3378070 RepID=UPI0038532BD4